MTKTIKIPKACALDSHVMYNFTTFTWVKDAINPQTLLGHRSIFVLVIVDNLLLPATDDSASELRIPLRLAGHKDDR
ncbi:hypothetical protein SUGI_0754480, partial [Cryptomeria japonica]